MKSLMEFEVILHQFKKSPPVYSSSSPLNFFLYISRLRYFYRQKETKETELLNATCGPFTLLIMWDNCQNLNRACGLVDISGSVLIS